MLTFINWQSYWTILIIVSLLYYLVILYIYFRLEIRNWVQHLFKIHHPSMPLPTNDGSAEDDMEKCIVEINSFLKESKKRRIVQHELLFTLQQILDKYPSLKNSECKKILARLIPAQCYQICSIQLSDEEVERVWLAL